jgi:outer membrane biosynthesis protein TonB
MRLTEILAWLDDEIERLRRARNLLAGKPALSTRRPKRTAPARKVTRPLKKAAKVREPEPPAPAPPTKVAEPIERKQRKRRVIAQRAARPSKRNIPSTALSGQVPAGPVAVSADEAQKARARAAGPQIVALSAESPNGAVEERSLGSLIRSLERREGLGGRGTS